MSSDLEWLDEPPPSAPEDDLPTRPPMRRRTRVLLVIGGLVVIVAAVVAGVTGTSSSQPEQAASSATLRPVGSSPVTPSVGRLPSFVPNGPPAAALVGIRAAFPGARLQSYVTVKARAGEDRPTDFYNLRTRDRRVTVQVAPLRREQNDGVFRTARSVEIAQQLGSARVDVTVTAPDGPTSQRDFEAIQQLVQDGRLLAPRGRATMGR